MIIGPGITIEKGITISDSPRSTAPITGATLMLDFDAANFSSVPASGTFIAGAGNYSITTYNSNGTLIWNSANGGQFRKTAALYDFLTISGPDYQSTSQAYTVMMVYRSRTDVGPIGRLLNTNSVSPDWLLGLWGGNSGTQNIFFNGAFVGSSTTPATNNWQFIWATYNGIPASPVSSSYVANSSQPTSAFGTRAGSGGFFGLRLFGRYVTEGVISEICVADVGLVKVWDGVLTLSEIQTQWSTYKTRFGY